MKNKNYTIKKIVTFLNNSDEDGGFWLPNIQRNFVWSKEQICRLFDSILREYPISTLLVWKTTSAIRRRKFIDNWTESLRLGPFFVPEDSRKKNLVLDGQQRLQALFIGLCGSYEGRELCLDVLSGEISVPDDVKYRFSFLDASHTLFPWVKFKDLVMTSRRQREVLEGLTSTAKHPLTDLELIKLDDLLRCIDRTFKMDDAITYQELDSLDNPTLYTEDDVVEVFIRANSGGTKLGKSDLLFSLLAANWPVANESMEDLLESLNKHGFDFDRDFILKTFLVLLGHGARYEVTKFRKPGVREDIEEKWDEIAGAIRDVLDFVRSKTFIRCSKALPSNLALIPLVYVRYRHPDAWRGAKDVDTCLLRVLLSGAFSGQPDNLIDALVKKLADLNAFSVDEVFGVIRTQNRSLDLTEERLWQFGYGSDSIHLLFNLWYRDFNYTPAYDNNLPQVDHIFPQSRLRAVKVTNPETGRDVMKYSTPEINHLANCMLLTMEENGPGGKSDTPPDEWFSHPSRNTPEYLGKHLIPRDPSLWKMERFEDFVAERKNLIRGRFQSLLVARSDATASE